MVLAALMLVLAVAISIRQKVGVSANALALIRALVVILICVIMVAIAAVVRTVRVLTASLVHHVSILVDPHGASIARLLARDDATVR